MNRKKTDNAKKKITYGIPTYISFLKTPRNWNTRATTYSRLLRYSVAVFSVVVVTVLKTYINPFLTTESPFLLYYLAIVISSWFGGFLPGLFATVLIALVTDFFFLSPRYDIVGHDLSQTIRLTLFFFEGIAISVISQSMHNALRDTELQKAQLERSEERYRLVVDTVTDYIIFTMNPEGYITSWNEGGRHITGYSTEEIVGSHLSVLYEQKEVEDRMPWKYIKSAAKEGRAETEGLRVRKDGSTFWANGIITPIRDKNEKLIGFSNIIRDRTQKREIEKRKDEFIGVASHELKTPLTSLKVFAQILQRIFLKKKDTEADKYISKMNGQIDRLTTLINDLLDVSKIHAGKMDFKMELFNINTLVKDIVDDLQETTPSHKIELFGKSERRVVGDKDRVGQVIINFLTNAIKYSPGADRVIVSVSSDEKNVTVAVQDFGIGINKEYLDKVFDRFYRIYNEGQKSIPGLGMGLFISMEIIKRHNGKIWVESKKGEGSTFFFSLPCQ